VTAVWILEILTPAGGQASYPFSTKDNALRYLSERQPWKDTALTWKEEPSDGWSEAECHGGALIIHEEMVDGMLQYVDPHAPPASTGSASLDGPEGRHFAMAKATLRATALAEFWGKTLTATFSEAMAHYCECAKVLQSRDILTVPSAMQHIGQFSDYVTVITALYVEMIATTVQVAPMEVLATVKNAKVEYPQYSKEEE
jgi:hypothetical protein